MKYMLYCHHCSNKVFTNGDDIDKFTIVPAAPLQKRADGKSNDTVDQKRKIKCPECGYVFKIVKLGPEQKIEEPKKDKSAEGKHPGDFEREMPKDPAWLDDKKSTKKKKK